MDKKKEILYCSTLCSEKMMDYLFRTSSRMPLISIQKFHRLVVEGLADHGCRTTALSGVPVSRETHKRICWKPQRESRGGINYVYLPFLNVPLARQLCMTVFAFLYALIWNLKRSRVPGMVICDALNVSVSNAVLLASRLCGAATCAIVTDIPHTWYQGSGNQKKSLIDRWANRIFSKFINSYDAYILLTEQMNELVNTRLRPFMIMEGLVDLSMKDVPNTMDLKLSERILIYAGGIYEEYGIKMLLEAFIQLQGDDLRLHIYGSGEMEEAMVSYMKRDWRIAYFGVVPNEVIVRKQIEATLLINPRPSSHEFTKYSFPSKTLESMVSGTPLITTPLPGIPDDFMDYLYILEDESVEGLTRRLQFLLSLPGHELHSFGARAKQFVLEQKSNILQTERILEFLNVA